MIPKHFFSIAVLSLLPTLLFAQATDSLWIKGQVTDSLQQPVAWATVTLTKGDSVIFTLPADANGSFLFTAKRSTGTALKITSAAYLPFTASIHWAQALTDTLHMGRLTLQQGGKALQNVTVTATKPLIKKEIDKLVYNTEVDPESKFSSVLDIMKKVPYLSVDGQEDPKLLFSIRNMLNPVTKQPLTVFINLRSRKVVMPVFDMINQQRIYFDPKARLAYAKVCLGRDNHGGLIYREGYINEDGQFVMVKGKAGEW